MRAKVDTADIKKINGRYKNMIQNEQKRLDKRARTRKIEILNQKEEIHNLLAERGVGSLLFK